MMHLIFIHFPFTLFVMLITKSNFGNVISNFMNIKICQFIMFLASSNSKYDQYWLTPKWDYLPHTLTNP